jgi:hypothetical protein
MRTFKPFAIIFALLLTAYCTEPAVFAQGEAKIRKGSTVPASCDVTGATSSPLFWKISGTNQGLYTCVAGVYVYQTNTFGSSLTQKTMLYASATPAVVTSTAAPTNGQLLIGSTGLIPALGTLTGTANETLITNGAGSITIGLAASLQHKAGANFLFTDTIDTTKKFEFIASAVTAGQTRDINIPDSNTFLPVIPQVLTVTGPTAARTITLFDANFTAARRDDFNAHTNVAAPATPGAGVTNTWTDAIDKNLKAKDDAGVITVTAKPLTVVDGLFVSGMSSAGVFTTGTSEIRLSTTPAVDMNTATPTTLYTCSSGRSCIITKVVVRNASTSLTTASYSFGWTSAAFNDVIADATHTELTGATLYTRIDAKAGATLGTSTGTFKVLMNTLQGGAATTTIDVFGYTF